MYDVTLDAETSPLTATLNRWKGEPYHPRGFFRPTTGYNLPGHGARNDHNNAEDCRIWRINPQSRQQCSLQSQTGLIGTEQEINRHGQQRDIDAIKPTQASLLDNPRLLVFRIVGSTPSNL